MVTPVIVAPARLETEVQIVSSDVYDRFTAFRVERVEEGILRIVFDGPNRVVLELQP